MSTELQRHQQRTGVRICVEDAVNLGYLLYRRTSLLQTPNDPRYREVEASINRRRELLSRYEDDEQGQLLVLAISEAAISYCDGLLRAKRIFDEKERLANDRHKAATRNRILTATKSGLVRGAVKLFLVGITVFSAALALLNPNPQLVAQLQHGQGNSWLTAMAFAGVIVLITIWFEITKLSATQDELFFKFGLSLARARVERESHCELELRNAWGMVERDFQRILGESMNAEDGALEALLGPGRERREEYVRDMDRHTVELQQSAVRRVLVMLGLAASQAPSKLKE